MIAFASSGDRAQKRTDTLQVNDGDMRQDVLASILEGCGVGGTHIIVNGIEVNDLRVVERHIEMRAGVGAQLWIDLRGAACPRLTANRQQALAPINAAGWERTIRGVFKRLLASVGEATRKLDLPAMRNVLLGAPQAWNGMIAAEPAVQTFDFLSSCRPVASRQVNARNVELACARFLQCARIARQDELAKRMPEFSTTDLRRQASGLDFGVKEFRDEALSFARAPINGEDILRHLDEEVDVTDDPEWAVTVRERRDFDACFTKSFPALQLALPSAILQAAFSASLRTSWPAFELFLLKGCIGDARVIAPSIIEFHSEKSVESDESDHAHSCSEELARFGYDLTFPMTGVPLGQLRRDCVGWYGDGRLRALGVAPFLFPSLHEVWEDYSDFLHATFCVPRVYALFPRFELWSKPFRQWTKEDWKDRKNVSVLWDISGSETGRSGRVLWVRGAHPVQQIAKVGLPAEEFLHKRAN